MRPVIELDSLMLKLLTSTFSKELSGVQNVKVYSYKELKVATDDFSPVNKIGEGGFGSVYKVTAVLIFLVLYKVLHTINLITCEWFGSTSHGHTCS